MIATRVFACLLLVVGVGAATASGPAWAQGEVTSALTGKDSKLDDALDDLSERAATSPDPITWRDLGIVQCRLGLDKDASESLDRAAPSLPEDFYLQVFRGLTAEMRGELAEAARYYDLAAELQTRLSERLAARANAMRARALVAPIDADGSFGDGPATVAILMPVDLGGGGAEIVPILGDVLHLGLAEVDGVDALDPSDTGRWLAADGRGAEDLDDETKRDRVGRGLARKGVEMVLASSFLRLESGEIHYRMALVPVSAEGVGPTVSVSVTPGASGAELAPLPEAIGTICTTLGVAQPAEGVSIPTSLDAARPYAEALSALGSGDLGTAQASFCRAQDLSPQVEPFAHWCETLEGLSDLADEPLAVDLSDPRTTVIEAVRGLATAERGRRRFDDLY